MPELSLADEDPKLATCNTLHQAHALSPTQSLVQNIVLSGKNEFLLQNGDGLRLRDIHFADHMPDMADEDRQTLRAARHKEFTILLSKKQLIACHLGPPDTEHPDRYGRLSVDVTSASGPFSLRRHLVAAGLAVVRPQSTTDQCCAALYRAEAGARESAVGIWATRTPLVRPVDPKTGNVDLPPSDFSIVEGWVRSVGEREREIYLNFGHQWAKDFTITVNKRKFSGSKVELEGLATLTGKRIRVRGIADPWGGGRIRVTRSNQIEVLTPLLSDTSRAHSMPDETATKQQ